MSKSDAAEYRSYETPMTENDINDLSVNRKRGCHWQREPLNSSLVAHRGIEQTAETIAAQRSSFSTIPSYPQSYPHSNDAGLIFGWQSHLAATPDRACDGGNKASKDKINSLPDEASKMGFCLFGAYLEKQKPPGGGLSL